MADIKDFAEKLVNLTVKEVNELAEVLKNDYGIEPAEAESGEVENNNNMKLSSFEKTIEKTDSIYDYNIFMLNKDYTQYQIIFNGTSDVFLKNMKEKNYNFDTQNKVWILK